MHPFYSNMIVILMSVFMFMSGVLLTALAYRPKEISEEWWEWTERFYKSGNMRIVGPSLIVVSLLLIMAALSYCLLKKHVQRMVYLKDAEDSAEHKSLEDENISWQVDGECLFVRYYDIACFPDGSPRYWLVQEF